MVAAHPGMVDRPPLGAFGKVGWAARVTGPLFFLCVVSGVYELFGGDPLRGYPGKPIVTSPASETG